MTSKLREAAAILVEQGRAIGRLEQARLTITMLTRESAGCDRQGNAPGAKLLIELANGVAKELGQHEAAASVAQRIAQEVVAELEHPGAMLARRLVATWRGARVAWRASGAR